MTRFTGMILPSGKARTAPRYRYRKQYATLVEGKSTRPAVGHSGPSTALRGVSDTPHRTAARASSSEPEWPMKWVNNCRPWYKRPVRIGVHEEATPTGSGPADPTDPGDAADLSEP